MDHRIEKTKQRIQNCLIKLSSEKPFPEITVKELCKEAGINRTTFYMHYKNTMDVLKEIEERAIQSKDWYNYLNKNRRQDLLDFLKLHKEEYSLLLDYGNIKQYLLSRSFKRNKESLKKNNKEYEDEDLMIATILTVQGLLESFRYMSYSDSTFDLDKILECMIYISNERYKELSGNKIVSLASK